MNKTHSGKIIDISPVIDESTAVFPGDTAFSRKVNLDFKDGHNLNLSQITTTVHIGAHTDAPNHYHPQGVGIHERQLDYYYGSCQVITVHLPKNALIKPNDISAAINSTRVLFRTLSFPNPENFNNDFNAIAPETIKFLASKNVKLIGIDTPSVDPANSKELSCHKEIYENNMAILEGIILTHVEDGNYTLSALPLKIKDADAAPVRAVLIKE